MTAIEVAILLNSVRLLNSRYRRILVERFGLNDGIPKSLEEVGRIFHVTRERIRQIEAKALRLVSGYYRTDLAECRGKNRGGRLDHENK